MRLQLSEPSQLIKSSVLTCVLSSKSMKSNITFPASSKSSYLYVSEPASWKLGVRSFFSENCWKACKAAISILERRKY